MQLPSSVKAATTPAGPLELQLKFTVAVTLERDQRSLDSGQLKWGVERIVDTGVESIGTANQSFVIDTQP
jgi:hypothetical protein